MAEGIRQIDPRDAADGTFITCLFCKRFNPATNACSEGETVEDSRNQICDKWRYVA